MAKSAVAGYGPLNFLLADDFLTGLGEQHKGFKPSRTSISGNGGNTTLFSLSIWLDRLCDKAFDPR
jgi:hypothetical protein